MFLENRWQISYILQKYTNNIWNNREKELPLQSVFELNGKDKIAGLLAPIFLATH